jgi:fluoride ion exporter CrcB/FEX
MPLRRLPTFSTFSLETFRLFEDGATGSALANIGSACAWGCSACGSARPGPSPSARDDRSS